MPLKDDLYERTSADRREERDLLGFLRQPEVRWLTPSLLAKSGIEVVVSAAFGKFADKRELQRDEQDEFHYTEKQELWVDYLSDTGDGWNATYTMAYLLAQDGLAVGGHALPRADVLLLGGDEVYPSAEPEAYEDRFIGPFASALPQRDPSRPRHLYATPGNHDWYDGLASFLRVFCGGRRFGGWQTRQRRSYFALRLAHNWWIWAIDIQLDTYIDDVQLKYFREQPLLENDKVVLMTAKPSWVKAHDGRLAPESWKYLAFFEDRLIRDRGARLAVTVTGDRHHYARYEPDGPGAGEAPTRITAGGGGAYLSPTHTLPKELLLQSLPRRLDEDTTEDRAPVHYTREETYPRADVSRRLAKGILQLRSLNPEFARLFGALYGLIAFAMLTSLNGAAGRLEDTTDGVLDFVSRSLGTLTIVLFAVVFAGTYSAAEIVPASRAPSKNERRRMLAARLAVTAVHGLIHLLPIAIIVYAGIELVAGVLPPGLVWLTWVVVLGVAYAAGDFLGTNVWARFLYAVHVRRGSKAQDIANQVFTGQSIPDYKNVLRMRFDARGGLTIYPIGVDAICKRWDYGGDEPGGPRFEPRAATPAVALVDDPLVFDEKGSRVAPAPPRRSEHGSRERSLS